MCPALLTWLPEASEFNNHLELAAIKIRECGTKMSNQHSTDNIKSGDTQEQSPKFVDWVPESELNVPRKLPPRLYHKKSKAGCQQCRARKVKVCFLLLCILEDTHSASYSAAVR